MNVFLRVYWPFLKYFEEFVISKKKVFKKYALKMKHAFKII